MDANEQTQGDVFDRIVGCMGELLEKSEASYVLVSIDTKEHKRITLKIEGKDNYESFR